MAADSASALPAAVVDGARAFDSTLAQVGGDTEGGQGGGGGFLEAARRSPRSMRRGLGAPGVHLSQRVLTPPVPLSVPERGDGVNSLSPEEQTTPSSPR